MSNVTKQRQGSPFQGICLGLRVPAAIPKALFLLPMSPETTVCHSLASHTLLGGLRANTPTRKGAEVLCWVLCMDSERSPYLKAPGFHIPDGSACVNWDTFPFYGFIFTPESRCLLIKDCCAFLRAERN